MKIKQTADTIIVIALPSLIHRIGGETTKHLKSVAADHGCELKRVRRSRHWQIAGEALALQAFYDQVRRLEEDSASYLVKKCNWRWLHTVRSRSHWKTNYSVW